MEDDILSLNTIEKLSKQIVDLKEGLSPEILSEWYNIVLEDFRSMAPGELRDTLKIEQDSILPMKFKIDVSKRSANYFIRAIERNLPKMPLATSLYFQKVEAIFVEKYNGPHSP